MTPGTFKIEDGILWLYDPTGEYAWRRIGKLEEVVAKASLDIPPCTVEQAETLAWRFMMRVEAPLRRIFPTLSRAWEETETTLSGALEFKDGALRRALALALRAVSDKLLEAT